MINKGVFFLLVLLVFSISAIGCSKKQGDDMNTTENPTVTSTEKSTESSAASKASSVNTIDAKTAMEMMASGEAFTLVDVRTQAEYDEGHIEGALLLPNDQLKTLAVEKLTDKDAVILVYCRSGSRSAKASKLLVELGYTNVYDFGGIINWPGEIVK